jgi:Lipocalin-like domain
MNRRNIFSLSAIAAVGFALLTGSALAQQKTLKEQLVGTWTVVSWNQDVTGGPQLQRFGADPKGYTMFDANGRVYVMFARPDLPVIASKNPSNPTPEEAKAIVSGSVAYFGTYTVDEGTKVVTIKVEASSFPNQLGTDQKRTVTSISPTELKLQNTNAIGGGQIYYVFKRTAAAVIN